MIKFYEDGMVPLPKLRFVKKDGRFILQQLWVRVGTDLNEIYDHEYSWCDVELVDEEGTVTGDQ